MEEAGFVKLNVKTITKMRALNPHRLKNAVKKRRFFDRIASC